MNPETSQNSIAENSPISDIWTDVLATLSPMATEVSVRNQLITDRDDYVYGDKLKKMLDIPIGHDITPVNWLKRIVEIHKAQFMGRPFHLISTYNSVDLDTAQDDNDKKRLEAENKKQKTCAELRQMTVENIIKDNGGHAMFMEGAESGSVVGTFVLKTWYDEDNKKFVISPVEAIENCYAVWSKDDFRQYDLFAYVYQVSKQQAISNYGCSDKVATSPLGSPLEVVGTTALNTVNSEPMVTIIEATGKIPGYCGDKGQLNKCKVGSETEVNVLFVGGEVKRCITDENKLPHYYILPNKKARRRPWGLSDITEAAIDLNLTYIETLSDWRTISNKVNFPKFKAFNFGSDVQMPKFKPRKIQMLPLGEGQDIGLLQMGDAGAVDFRAQIEEIKEQFVRETGVAQVLLDNSGMSMNSNQALITSMKPTSDIAEAKKELWSPILVQLFTDALNTLAAYDKATYGDLVEDSTWQLRVQWPSTVQKEDPIYQQMLLNRWNSRTISLQSFLEAQGESIEEVERIKDEMSDILTAAIHSGQLATVFGVNFMPAPTSAPPKVNVSLRGDLSPYQEANLASQHGFNGGQGQPFPASAGPTGSAGIYAQDNAANQGFLTGTYPNQTPTQKGPDGKPIATPANNTPGTQPVSQPGSGATAVSPQGAVNQTSQNVGQ